MEYSSGSFQSPYHIGQLTLENHPNDGHWVHTSHASQMGYPGMGTYDESEPRMKDSIQKGKGNQYYVPQATSFDPRSPNSTYCSNLVQDTHRYPPGINTNFAYRTRADSSPLLFSPSPELSPGQFYIGGYGGSTPSLLSSTSSPPTGRSCNILLTPGSGSLPGSQLPGGIDQFDQTNVLSPGIQGTGATPDIGVLDLDLDDSEFQLALATKDQGARGPQALSVLLSSAAAPENTQPTDLEPLEENFTDFNQLHKQSSNVEPIANYDNEFSINIKVDGSGAQNVPITVALEAPKFDTDLLSPLLQLQGLPTGEGGGVDYHNQMQSVAFESTRWDAYPNPGLPNTRSLGIDNRRPTNASPLSFAFRGGDDQLHVGLGSFHSSRNTTVGSVQNVLQAVHAGQCNVVNPKGVSERTLAAAEANRKREARFRCNVCGNSQTSKQNLENHVMSRHMQLKRFACPVPHCSAKYGHARGVNRHLDSKHPGFRQPSSKGKRGPSKQA